MLQSRGNNKVPVILMISVTYAQYILCPIRTGDELTVDEACATQNNCSCKIYFRDQVFKEKTSILLDKFSFLKVIIF